MGFVSLTVYDFFNSGLVVVPLIFLSGQIVKQIQPPRAKKVPQKITTHGHERIDNYYWLRQRDNPKVMEHLKAENEYTSYMMRPLRGLRRKLFAEMKSRIKEDDSTVPYKVKEYYYYTRFEEGFEYPLYCRKKALVNAKEEILLNVNLLAEHHRYYLVKNFKISRDQKIAAFSADSVGRRIFIIYFVDLLTGKLLPDKIDKVTGDFEWANDNRTIFYVKQNPKTLRQERILKHILGGKKDETVYYESDETFITDIGKTLSGKYLFIKSTSTQASEYQLLPADEPEGKFRVFYAREAGHQYQLAHGGEVFYILTNKNAGNFKLVKCPENHTNISFWEQVIPHRENVFLEQLIAFKDFIAIQERNEGLACIAIMDRLGEKVNCLEFNEETYSVQIGMNSEYETEWLRYNYESLTTPPSVYDYHIRSGQAILKKSKQVLGDFSPADYQSKRFFATASDGEKIPLSLVYKKEALHKGGNPVLLYGYGSYGHCEEPVFNSALFSLLNRGFIFAMANIRGGSEMGRRWYEQGRLLHKKNTFSDFISCAEYLIQKKYTTKERLYAMGRSAGGLLMGAIINMRGDLFHGVVTQVPFVDVVTTMLDASIPLTTYEYSEWGNPENKEFYDYMLSYSPYDNVTAKEYPHMLVSTGYHDALVQYWEPAKWIAKLRELKTDNHLLLFKINMQAGHSGASGRFERLEEIAYNYAFLLNLENIKD